MEASWIDNLFLATPYPEMKVPVAEPAEIFEELQETVDLLERLKNETLPLP